MKLLHIELLQTKGDSQCLRLNVFLHETIPSRDKDISNARTRLESDCLLQNLLIDVFIDANRRIHCEWY